MSENERVAKITPAQERAISALLSCRTLEDAASAAGVGTATLRRWRDLPAFDAAYKTARLALLESATNALRGATSDAVDALRRALTCGKPAAEIRAAEVILTNAYKSAEIEELSERIAALEARLEGNVSDDNH